MNTTKKDFDYFCKRCEYWKNKLNLNDWAFTYFHEKLDGNSAEYSFDIEHKQASIWLSTEYGRNITTRELDNTASHEVIELSFAKIQNLLEQDFSKQVVNELLHTQVHVIQNLIYNN